MFYETSLEELAFACCDGLSLVWNRERSSRKLESFTSLCVNLEANGLPRVLVESVKSLARGDAVNRFGMLLMLNVEDVGRRREWWLKVV